MPEILDPFLEFFKTIHKYYWYEITIIIIAFILDLTFIFYLAFKKINRERLIDKFIEKIKPRTIIFYVFVSVITSIIAILFIANKNTYDYKVIYYPYSIEPTELTWSDTVYNLSYIFENKSDLPTEINNISFYITLNKNGILESNLDSMGKEGILKLHLDSQIVKLIMPSFNLPSAQYRKSVPLSLDYLRENKYIEIITTCISVKNPERISIKTEISWDTTKQGSPFSIKYDTTYDKYFDKIPVQENIVYKWRPETTNDQDYQLKKSPLSNRYIPKVPENKNKENKEVKERRKLSESTYQENSTTSSTSRRKLSEQNTIDSTEVNKKRKLSNPK